MKFKEIPFEKIFNYTKLFSIFSVLTGILYQYISLRLNLAFFSYSKVIDDSISVVPFILIFLWSIWLSYLYIYNYKKLDNKINSKRLPYYSFILSVLITIFISQNYKYISNFSNNNIIDLFILFILYFSAFNVVSHIYVISLSKKTIIRWYIVFAIILYILGVSKLNDIFYKNLCFEYEKTPVHVNYMNDRYIFLDNQNMIKAEQVKELFRMKDCKIK